MDFAVQSTNNAVQNPVTDNAAKDDPRSDAVTDNNSVVSVDPVIPKDNFIVAPEIWKKAFVLYSTSGDRTYGVGFSGISGEIKLYSPIDGDVTYTNDEQNGSGRGKIIISADGKWNPASTMEALNDPARSKSLEFVGYGMEAIVTGPVKKGQQIGIIKPGQAVYTDYLKEKATLVFEPEAEWDKGITRSEDPVEYIKQVISIITDFNAPQSAIISREDLVVKDDLWESAFITHQTGKKENDGIGFLGLPDNTVIYAPIDGYVHFYDMSVSDQGTGNMLAIATTDGWVPNQTDNGPKDRAIQFFSYGIEPLAFDKVKKGDKIAVFHPGKAVLSKFIDEKADLVMTPDSDWAKMESPSNDPFGYMDQLMDLMK